MLLTLQLRLRSSDWICNIQSDRCILHTCDLFKFQRSVNKFFRNSSQNKYSCKSGIRIHSQFSFSISNFYIHRDSDDLYIFSQLNSAAMRNRYHDFWWVSFAHPRCHCFNCEKRLMSQRKVVNYCSITSFNAVPIIVASLFIFDACINAYLIIHFTAIPVACCECYVEKKES